jgi:two-component system, NarL family, nitrate/nitrite response regulator NarL
VVVSAHGRLDREMAPRRRIRVYLADDHPLFLRSIAGAVEERPSLELVGQARDGLSALEDIRRLRPDVAVVDVRMGGKTGAEIVAAATMEGLETRILILSAYLEDDLVYDTLASGAMGYLSKEMDREEIMDAVATVARGEVVVAPAVQTGLVRELRRRGPLARPELSARELEILSLAAQGKSTPEIAAALRLSGATVKTHLQKIYDRLGVNDRTSAVVVAMRRRLLD